MRDLPEAERQDVRTILEKWEFAGQELEEVLERIVSKEKAWLDIMMAHELNLARVEEGQPRRSSLLVFAAAIVGSLIPLAPFILAGNAIVWGIAGSVVTSGVTLFLIGWYKARLTIGRATRSGAQMVIIGIASAAAGFGAAFLVDKFFGV
jgi:VIT1/CCC1 family predicted Fe2+/Mn2+ transporter